MLRAVERRYRLLRWADGDRSIPYGPLWGGMIINAVSYGLFLWFLWFALAHARRHLRARRGLCPACGYPVGEAAVCSECGKPVRNRRPSAT